MIDRIIIAYEYIEGAASTNRVLCFAKGYRDNGKQVHLVLYASKEAKEVQIDGVEVIFVTEPSIPGKYLKKLFCILQFVKTIKRLYQPSKTVIHIYRTPWYGYFFNPQKYNIFFERGEVPFYSETKSILFKLQERIGLRVSKRSKGLLAQTYSLKDFYGSYGVKNIEVINMFVDVSRFENLRIDKSIKYIAYCGTICKHKDGVDDLIKAFEIVHRKHCEYKLMLIGGFEAIYNDEQYLREMVVNLNLNDSVVFTGKVKPCEIPTLLANASILALARPMNKQTQYGFPTKLGEYLCTGNPIVLTNVGEIGMYMKDHVNCIFAQPDNYQDFAQKLLWAVENYDEAKKMGAIGYSLINSDFSILSQTKNAIDFMERVSDPKI